MTLPELLVVTTPPPCYDRICALIGVPGPATVYTYGDVIHNPSGQSLPHHLLVHEHTHSMQQRRYGGAEAWWERYLVDELFRYAQELDAYRAEYQAFGTEYKDRNVRARFLWQKASDLAGPLYGRVASFDQACREIKR